MRNIFDKSKEFLRRHFLFIFFFFFFTVTGLIIYNDYGISWDESISHENNGRLNYKFIKDGDSKPLLTGIEKYHGPVFEIFLVSLEKIFSLKETREIYFMRHLFTFLFFAIAVLFFYMLCIRYLKSHWVAFIGTVFLVFSPRIFADAFYNSKDLTFMCFIIINLYSTMRFLEKKTFLTAIFHGIVSAITIDIRILGAIIPCFTFLFLLIDFIKQPQQRKSLLLNTVIYSCFFIGVMILCWPVLWLGPAEHFVLALKEMSKYPWPGKVLYRGEVIDALKLPWDYIPYWIMISTPLFYLVFFIAGIYFIITKLFKRIKLTTLEYLNVFVFFFPIISVIFLHSIVYDGWRHLYFIYPSFLVIALSGLERILQWKKKVSLIINAIILIYIIHIGKIMFDLHPYQNLYFNSIAGSSLDKIRQKFEMDYWGLSFREGLEYILKNDTAANIIVSSDALHVVNDNMKILPYDQSARLSISDDRELSDYFITNFRTHPLPYGIDPDYSIIRDKGIVLSVYDLRNENENLLNKKYRIAHFENLFEDTNSCWPNSSAVINAESFSGNHVFLLNSTVEYSSSFQCNPYTDQDFKTNSKKYLSADFQIKTKTSYDAIIVCQLISDSKTIAWKAEKIHSSLKNSWIKKNFRIFIPELSSPKQDIRIYIWNLNRNEFIIDDFQIDFYSIPQIDFSSIEKLYPKDKL